MQQAGRAGVGGQGPQCITATEARPLVPQALLQGLKRAVRAPQWLCLGFLKAGSQPCLYVGVYSKRTSSLLLEGSWVVNQWDELWTCSYGGFPAVRKGPFVSLLLEQPLTGACTMYPASWEAVKGQRVVYGEVCGTWKRWWSWCKISHRSEVFILFFPIMQNRSHSSTPGCTEGVSAARVSHLLAAAGQKTGVGCTLWYKFRQNYHSNWQN